MSFYIWNSAAWLCTFWMKVLTEVISVLFVDLHKVLISRWQCLLFVVLLLLDNKFCVLRFLFALVTVVLLLLLDNQILCSLIMFTLVTVLFLFIIIIITGLLGYHRWFCNQFSPFFPVLHCPLGLAELQACPFLDVFPRLPLSALSSSPFYCALQDRFGQTCWTRNMTIPLQFTSHYDGQVFMLSNCLLDLGMDFLVSNMVFVWDV